MRGGLAVFVAALVPACAAIADFDDFTADCPAGKPDCPAPASGGMRGTGGSVSTGGSESESGGADAGTGGSVSASGGSLSTGGSAGAAACDGRESPGKHGPEMALVLRGDGALYWMDRTEITVGQYAEYVNAGAPPRSGVCELPSGAEPFQCEADAVPDDPGMPRTCVDWCEADGFCAWAGKRLCSDLPELAASAPTSRLRRESEFFAACSPTDAVTYGCGEDCVPGLCNGASAGRGELVPAGSFPRCCVPDACGQSCAIFDLSGNVGEWTAGCSDTTADGDCVVRGGDYESLNDALQCITVSGTPPRRTRLRNVGFRCCADAG